jgi:hypothetical protein
MAEYQDQWCVEHLHGVLQACDDVIAGEIACHAADEDIAACRIKTIFRRDARVGATENGGEWVLSRTQGLAFMIEVMPSADTLDITSVAFHQAVECSIRG